MTRITVPASRVLFLSLIASLILLAGCSNPTVKRWTGTSEFDQLEKAAQDGNAQDQYRLGTIYCCGEVSRRNTRKAIHWLCSAAVKGHIEAQYQLAKLYGDLSSLENAREKDPETLSNLGKSYFWYTAAASQGYEPAFQTRDKLGNMMDPQDVMTAKRRARRWRHAACVPL